jgi:hypothetical protein
MRPLLIVLLAELFQQRRPGRKLERPAAMPHAVIQRTMKAFDFAACLRVIRPSVQQIDALLDQAHGKLREPMAIGYRPPRHSVIQQHRLGQTVPLKGLL